MTGLLCPSQGVVQLGITLSEETEDHIQVRRREVGEIGKLNCHLLYTTTVAVLSVIIALSLPSPHIYHTHTHTHSLAHNHTHSHTHVLSHTHTHTLSYIHTGSCGLGTGADWSPHPRACQGCGTGQRATSPPAAVPGHRKLRGPAG